MNHYWYYLVGVVALFFFTTWYISGADGRRKRKEEKIKKKEKWGEFLKSDRPKECFGIARWTNNIAPKEQRQYWSAYEDSRQLLERLGFRILGIIDEMLYRVEPPKGWKEIPHDHPLYTYIVDEEGNRRLLFFRKNDIMDMSDYRAWISENVKD